jgi:hypothetical protein
MLGCSNAEDAEAKAALKVKGPMLLVGSGHDKIILELDCARAVVAPRSSLTDRSVQWATYDRAKSLIKTFLNSELIQLKERVTRLQIVLLN